MEILCFFAGIAFFYIKSAYALLFILISLFLRANWLVIVWFLTAICWCFFHQWWIADQNMPTTSVINNAILQGIIISIPNNNLNKAQFQFLATELNGHKVKAQILLSCYQHCPTFAVGQAWQMVVKLKKPRNLANPGHFNYLSWLSARHINWTGYVKIGRSKLLNGLVKEQKLLLLRQKLALSLNQISSRDEVTGVIQALTLGITTKLNQTQWELFRHTGTTHLMVISGSHIGLIAGISYWLIKKLWSCSSRLCLYRPAAQIASIVAIIMALIYALLAGFAPPAQRALVACFFLLIRNFVNYRFTTWQTWRYALFAVLVYEPHVVLLPGFYLSFIAVAILLLINQRFAVSGYKKIIILQIACLVGLMPLSCYWFSYGAVNGFIANLIAIPLVSFAIVPFALINLLLLQWSFLPKLTIVVNTAVEVLLHYLHWVDLLEGVNFKVSFTHVLTPIVMMLVMLLFLLLPLKTILPSTIVLALSGFFPSYPRIKMGEARVDILDVSQGLAVVINTARHTMIYDTGVKFYQGGDMAKLAIIPFLNTLGIKTIDKVVISHPDLDHRGGLHSLESSYEIKELLVDNVSFYKRGKSCHSYPAWQWDGVSFRFLTINQKVRSKNNASCVLQIENSQGRILLTGDIEKLAEDFLVRNYGKKLDSDILLVAHHGSKTSSSFNFINHVAPKYAIISSGFDNRYHFPHQKTKNTFHKFNIPLYNTAECGMVTTLLTQEKVTKPTCFREK